MTRFNIQYTYLILIYYKTSLELEFGHTPNSFKSIMEKLKAQTRVITYRLTHRHTNIFIYINVFIQYLHNYCKYRLYVQ